MKHIKLAEALDAVDGRYIAEAAKQKKKRKKLWFGAVAAVLVAVILWWSVGNPVVTAKAVSLADYSGNKRQDWQTINGYREQLSPFFSSATSQVLSGSGGENVAFSPLNLYFALAVTAELSGGNPQILQLLNADGVDSLRSQSFCLWNATYRDQNNQCLLANSLWLDKDLSYNQDTMDILADRYYTSVYQGDFGTNRTNRDIANWLGGQTGGILKDATDRISLDPDTVFALYATIYYQAKWSSEFKNSQNTEGTFYGAQGDVTCTFMNKNRMTGNYMWGESFGAVTISLKDGSRMWLILPDEDKTVDQVLASDDLWFTMFGGQIEEDLENSKYMFINLSVPKFDIQSGGDLKADLRALGVTEVFDRDTADFTAIYDDGGDVWLTAVNQATRVAIDEKGVTAASYIEIPGAGAAAPPEEVIDFVLDRPFIFLVTNMNDLPLFAGVVNEP